MTGTRPRCVDVHAHAVPRAFVREVARSGLGGVTTSVRDGSYQLQFPGEAALRPVAGVMMAFAERAAWLDQQDVDVQFVAPWLDVHGQQLPSAEGRQWVRLLNDALHDAVCGLDGRLRAYATLHLADPESAAEELDRACSKLGMVGCMIPTNFPGGYLDEPRFDAFWAAAAELQVPVVLHPPTEAPSASVFARYPKLRTLARAVDLTVVAAALISSGVLDRFPQLTLVLVHGGGYLPYQIGRLDHSVDPNSTTLPSDYLCRFSYDSTALTTYALRMLIDSVGSQSVMVGSDYAATNTQPPWRPHSLTENVLENGAQDNFAILQGNARRLFRLGLTEPTATLHVAPAKGN